MKKLMVYLPDEMHEDLRTLAFKRRSTMAALIREAVETAFEDELDAIMMDRELEEYARDPDSAMSWDEFKKSIGLETPQLAGARRRRPK